MKRQRNKKWPVASGQWSVEEQHKSRECFPGVPPHPSSLATSHWPLATSSPRRGVLLLVVLSLLMLFSLIAVTFVLVAGRHYDATRYAIRNEQVGDDPRQLLDEVFAQCIRGTNNPHSVIGPHSLLEDMYGNDGIIYRQVSVTPTALGVAPVAASTQLLDLTFTPVNPLEFTAFPGVVIPPTFTLPYPLSLSQIQTPGYFNGCVLTAIGGAADGRSTRIVGWGYNGSQYRIRLLTFEGLTFASVQTDPPLGFVVNGRPFNGTGFGFDPNATATSATLLAARQTIALPASTTIDIPYALLSNPIYWDGKSATGLTVSSSTLYPFFGGLGGADEDYDAGDTQNMLLAHLPLSPPNGNIPAAIIPSLHRPDTYSYLTSPSYQGGTLLGDPEAMRLVLRQSTLRPLSSTTIASTTINGDHPQFPSIDLAAGPYDVDNDGDGIAESIWVDAGLPVRTAPDGRQYKPLVAILCLDLDGRLNVNAHGNISHVDEYYHSSTAGTSPPAFSDSNLLPQQFVLGATVAPELPRGQGYGTPEISLVPLFRQLALPPASLTAAERQAYSRLLATRYSEPNSSLFDLSRDGSVPQPTYNGMPGFTPNAAYPGATAFGDRLAGVMRSNYPDPIDAIPQSAFGSPANLWGRGFVALDLAGIPLMPYMGMLNERDDSPYELNLNRRNSRSTQVTGTLGTPVGEATPNPLDTPFSVAELERILRLYDVDAAMLPDRLRSLVDGVGGPPLALLRNMITTDSFDVPAPPLLPTPEIRQTASNIMLSSSIVDLLRERMLAEGFSSNIGDEILKMLPQEVIAGRKFDLNRPFGNGRDDDTNGVVDEPEENESSLWSATGMSVPGSHTSTPIIPNYTNGLDVDLNGTADEVADRQMSRQLFARHLYILMMLLKGNAEMDFDGNAANNSPEETARGLAQWAVNIVDFRDRDSIMTPFHYNIYPFRDGWTANGDLTASPLPGTAVVWGMERPELLITETLAYHDRRTEDLDNETLDSSDGDPETMPGTTMAVMPTERDSDFDQRLRPFAPFFIELYNPWLTQSSIDPANAGQPSVTEMPAELYTNPTYRGVNLQAVDPIGNTPVWRMLVVADTSIGADPDDHGPPTPTVPFVAAHVDRMVFFNNPSSVSEYPAAPRYFADPTQPLAPVLPGRHAVVGSAGLPGHTNLAAREFISPIARVQGAGEGPNPANRKIILRPNANPNQQQVEIQNNNAPAPVTEPPLTEILPTVAVPLTEALVNGTPLSFPTAMASISEPRLGYPALTDAGNIEGGYSPPLDIPLDKHNATLNGTASGQPPDGTRQNFRMIHLQRLANPLKAWNPNTNPYLTIDSMSIDVTVFNGVAATSGPGLGTPSGSTYSGGLASYQRGDIAGHTNPPLWYSQPLNTQQPAALVAMAGSTHYFGPALRHSLGYLNLPYGTPGDATSTFTSSDPLIQTSMRQAYLGLPKAFPFTWLTWNNRPFANEMELLLIPQVHSSRLASSYATLPRTPYEALATRGHLPNLWEKPAVPLDPHVHLHRILDYVHVPSRFVGTEMELPPANFVNQDPYEKDLLAALRPPFNRISHYREPGRVNINTIPSNQFDPTLGSAIWDGIKHTTPDQNLPLWETVAASRQGSANFVPGSQPTRFANPFRSVAGAAYLLPGTGEQNRGEIDVSFLRSEAPQSNASNSWPLFRYQLESPLNPVDTNPYFRTSTLLRLRNLLTTRSNVYAIWITVGYFEVRSTGSTGSNTPYPDGYQLFAELGSETGEIKRHRAFYIYDRSIPVGFERGKDHNMADGVLLRRFIE